MRSDDWNSIVMEHFDIKDTVTRKCLISINEEDQSQVAIHLANKFYEIIVKNVTNIDFGQIPNSKGDITKIPNYMELIEALETMNALLVEFKSPSKHLDVIFKAIDNMKKYKTLFMKAYAIDCEMPVIFYNTMALSIISATSLFISSTVEFIKTPEGDFEISLAKTSKSKTFNAILYKNIEKFNKACKSGDFEKSMNAVLSTQRKVAESVESVNEISFAPFIVISLITFIIPILHQLTLFIYNMRQKISDYLSVESDIIKLNAEKVQYNRAKSEDAKKKIRDRQMKIADRLKSMSNILAIKASKAEKDTEKEIADVNNKKYKIDDIMDTIPDSSIF